MGAFFGAIYVRAENREPIRSALAEVARKTKRRFLLAPSLRGWFGIYPDTNGQDEKISKAIAKQVAGDVLHDLVHHSDIFCYFYYREGQLVDQYNSAPDYFGKVSESARKKQRGRPELLRDLLLKGDLLHDLTNLLHATKKQLLADRILEKFAELLQLPNALTSYEYLMDGETDEFEGWEQTVHIPDQSAEKAAKRAEVQALDQEKQQLRDAGLLLLEQTAGGEPMEQETPFFCADPQGNGFLVVWSNVLNPRQVPLFRFAPPWSGGA